MRSNWLERHLVPLTETVPDYEVRRRRALRRAAEISESPGPALPDERREWEHPRYEIPVSTPDNKVYGRIDAIRPGTEGPVLQDYKSGAVFDGAGDIRSEYSTQLKLYAAAFAGTTGRWPSRLEIVPLSGPPLEVPFTRAECEALLSEAYALLHDINAEVERDAPVAERHERLAKPGPEACTFCPYRPTCHSYYHAREKQPNEAWPRDIDGTIGEQRVLGNGRTLITLLSGDKIVRVRGLSSDPDRHPALAHIRPGEAIAIFGLRRGGGETSFVEGDYTTIYVTRSFASEAL